MEDIIGRAMDRVRGEANIRRGAERHRGSGSAETVTPEPVVRPSPRTCAVSWNMLEGNGIVTANKNNPNTRTFDMLRTQVLRAMSEKGWRTVGVTSPTRQCGKTTAAINLAISIANQTTGRVVLVDFDLKCPRIGEYLGIEGKPDLSDVLEVRAPLEAALVDPGIPGLLVLPNGKAQENSSGILAKSETVSLVKDLRSNRDVRVTIFDLPPVLTTDDTLAFLPQVDCLLIMLADGKTTKPELEETRRLLEGTPVVGYVLNQCH